MKKLCILKEYTIDNLKIMLDKKIIEIKINKDLKPKRQSA